MISIYSTKGGVGKTSIAFSLAKDLNLNYYTNDFSASSFKLNKVKTSNNLTLKERTIYDFGGFESKNAIDISNQSNLVIVPTICDMNSLARAISTIKKISHRNILVIATNIDSKKDFDDVKKVINHHFPEIEVIMFRRTKLLKNAIEEGVGALSISSKGLYKSSLKDYNKILEIARKHI